MLDEDRAVIFAWLTMREVTVQNYVCCLARCNELKITKLKKKFVKTNLKSN